VADRVISNPIINSPYRAPRKHFAFDNDGITDRIVDGRRPSSYFVPVPRPRKRRTQQQLEFAELTADQIEKNQFVNDIRARMARWREMNRPDVTPTTHRLLEYWTDPDRENPILFAQLEAAETAIYLAEAAQKEGDTWIRNELDKRNAEHNAGLDRIALKMATGTGKTVVMAMLIAWQTLNKVASPQDTRFAKRFLIVTPGLTIRDRDGRERLLHPRVCRRIRGAVPGLVTSITGLSAIGAAAILAQTGDPHRFATARALVKHAGLAPREKLSGTFTGRTKLTGQGRPGLRLATWRAVWGAPG